MSAISEYEQLAPATCDRAGARPRVAMIVGGTLGSASTTGDEPRIDEHRLAEDWNAAVFDMAWLAQRAEQEWFSRCLLWAAQRFGAWSFWLTLRVWYALRDIDVIYATGEDVGVPLAALLRATRRSKPRLVLRLEQWTFGRTRLRRMLYHLLLGYALPRVDLSLCRTRAHLQLLQEAFLVPAARLRLVPETIDNCFFAPEAPPEPGVTNVAPAGRFIVSAGLEMRDYATLIAAVRGLPIQVIIGAGSPWSKMRFDQGARPDLPPNVTVSSYAAAQMRELYRSAALVVVPLHPTLRSCGITVVLEAWAMARPVLATRTVGLSDYIENETTGVLVETKDAAALRAQIMRLLSDPEATARLGRNGYYRVANELNQGQFLTAVSQALAGDSPQATHRIDEHHFPELREEIYATSAVS